MRPKAERAFPTGRPALLDTLAYTKFHRELSAKSYIINANLKYVDANRKALRKRWTSFDEFRRDFVFPKEEIDKMIADAAKDKVLPKDNAELEKTLPKLSMQLKALVARDLWDMSEYFAIINEESEIVRKAADNRIPFHSADRFCCYHLFLIERIAQQKDGRPVKTLF